MGTTVHSSFVVPEAHLDAYVAHLLRYEFDDDNHCTKAEHFNGETRQWVEHTEGLVLTGPALSVPGVVARQLQECKLAGHEDRRAIADEMTDMFESVLAEAGVRA